MKKFFSAFLAAVTISFISTVSMVSALNGVGQEKLCLVNDTVGPVATNDDIDGNDLFGQTFTTTTSYNLGAVKFNIFDRDGTDGSTIRIYVVNVDGSGRPDMNSILGSEVINVDDLPLYPLAPVDRTFSCDPDFRSGQVAIFDPPIALSGSTQYAITIKHNSGLSTAPYVSIALSTFDDFYPGGHFWDCGVPIACTELTPATWDLSHGVTDGGLALFDNIVSASNPPGSAELWLDNLLNTLGMNDTNGRLVVGIIAGLFILVAGLVTKVHPLIILALEGMWGGAAVTATLIPPEITLTMVVIVLMMLVLGIAIRISGDD